MNLASAYLNTEKDKELPPFGEILEISEYIVKHGLSLCCNCVSVFKELYCTHFQLKKLSNEASLLTKAVKKYSPSGIKIEWTAENVNNECNNINIPKRAPNLLHLSENRPEKSLFLATEVEESSQEDLFHSFNYEEAYEEFDEDQEDVKVDPIKTMKPEDVISSEFIDSKPNRQMKNNNTGIACSSHRKRDKGYSVPGRRKRIPETLPRRNTKSSSEDDDYHPNSPNNYVPKSSSMKDSGQKLLTSSRVYLTRLAISHLPVRDQKWELEEASSAKSAKSLGIDKKQHFEKSRTGYKRIDEKQLEKLRGIQKRAIRKAHTKCWTRGKNLKNKMRYKKIENQESSTSVRHSKKVLTSGMHSKEHSNLQDRKKYDSEGNDNTNKYKSPSVPKRLKNKHTVLACSCGKGFSSLHGLQKHETRVCGAQGPVMCDLCGQIFPKNYLLYGHKGMKHSVMTEILYKCDLCDAKYLSVAGLTGHREYHHQTIDPVICDKCGRSCKSRKSYHRHALIHRDEGMGKEFKCGECGIVLKHDYGLKKHMRVMHRNQKTFSCKECGKTTKNMTNMRIHMKVHDPSRTVKRKPQTTTAVEKPSDLNSTQDQDKTE